MLKDSKSNARTEEQLEAKIEKYMLYYNSRNGESQPIYTITRELIKKIRDEQKEEKRPRAPEAQQPGAPALA